MSVKKGKIGIVILGIIVLILLVVGMFVVKYFNSPQYAVKDESENLYGTALEQIENGEYEKALETLDSISVDWAEYNNKVVKERVEVTEKYKEKALKDAEDYLSNDDYTSAMSVLEVALKIVGDDETIQEKLNDITKDEVLDKVKTYKETGEYAQAIQYINENMGIVDNDSEVLVELNNCQKLYRDAVISEAEAVYKSQGYEAAVKKIKEGLVLLDDDEKLKQEKEKYEKLAPVYLKDLHAYVGELYLKERETDNMGNVYQNCFWASSNIEKATYDVGMKYKTLKATVAVTKAKVNTALYNNNYASIKIIGDNKVLYENSMLSITTKPYEIEIDITGITDLTIEMEGDETNLYDSSGLYVIMADAILQSE